MQSKKAFLSVLLVAIFAVGIVGMAVPVKAVFTGDVTIMLPDKVVPGGSVAVYSENFDSDKVWTYFFLSTEKESEISTGDIEIAKVDTDDVEDEIGWWPGIAVPIPTDVEPDDYYVKVSYDNDVGDECLLTKEGWGGDATVEVIEEADWPTITVDPESDVVFLPFPDWEYNTVDVDGEDIDTDYDYAYLYWDKYVGAFKAPDWHGEMAAGAVTEWAVEEGEFSAEDVELNEAFMGEHSILVLLYDEAEAWPDGTLGTFVEFTVEPSVGVWHACAGGRPDKGGDATADFSTDEAYSGIYSMELYVNCSTQSSHADVVIDGPWIPFSEVSEFVYHYYIESGASPYAPHMCFYLTNNTHTADVSGPEPSTPGLVGGIYPPTYNAWTKVTVNKNSGGFFWYGSATGVGIPQGMAGMTTLNAFLTNAVLKDYYVREIRIEFGWWSPVPGLTGTAYVDYASLNGMLIFDDPYKFSVEAEELDQIVYLWAHGFPEDGTVEEDSIDFIVKGIVTGEDVTKSTKHDEVDVEDEPPGTFEVGGRPLEVEVDEPPEGIIDIKFTCDGEVFTLEDMYLSSTDSDPGKLKGRLSTTSGEIGDDVTFYVIDLPAGVTVDVIFANGVSVSLRDDLGEPLYPADCNGAFSYRFELRDLPGGTYDVTVKDINNKRAKTIGTFELLPTVSFYDFVKLPTVPVADITATHVDDMIFIRGVAFPVGSVFDTIVIGGEDIEFDEEVEVDFDGIFDSRLGFKYENFTVPHVSGGGLDVAVEIKGEDAEGDPLTIEAEITIDPKLQPVDLWDEDEEEAISEGVLVLNHLPQDVEPGVGVTESFWESYLTADIFGGNPMKITGVGFLAGESVTVTFTSEDEDLEEACLITYGGKADSDGDLEVVFMLPRTSDFASTIADGDLEVAGTTDTNVDSVFDRYEEYVYVTALNDDKAKLFFGLEPDGDLDTTVYVGDEVRMVGVGFKTKSLTLEIEGDEVGTPTASYGFFDTKITIPELERGEDYVVDEVETVTESTEFEVESKVVLTSEEAIAGATVTAYGTGWLDDEDVTIEWPDLPALADDIDPDSGGSWEETFTVPDVEPGPYTILFYDEPLEDAEEEVEVTFRVLGPLKIASLTMPGTVYPESTITISVNVQDYFGTAVSGAAVTGKITPPVGAAVTLTFPATDAAGISSASWKVPADAAEGTYKVDVTASKPEAGGTATTTGTFYVEPKFVPPPPVDISKLEKSVSDLSKSVIGLSGDLSKLATDVSGLKSDIAKLEAAIAAIPIVPVEWIYITAIMAIIAAIAAIAAVVAVYRKIA